MSETTKFQQYRYSLRTMCISPTNIPNGLMCGDKFYVFPVPPEDAISIENLYLQLRVRFNTGVPVGERVIERIGIANNRPFFGDDPIRWRYYDLNQAADGNREVDIKIDLSALLKKDDVRFHDYFDGLDPAEVGYTYVYIETASTQSGAYGDLLLCKMDALYTTTGIR